MRITRIEKVTDEEVSSRLNINKTNLMHAIIIGKLALFDHNAKDCCIQNDVWE